MIRKMRVLVCGSTFGQCYLLALQNQKEEFELAGILAKGSQRSVQTAQDLNIPLYTDIEELPSNIDVACVVVRSEGVGGNGTAMACQLLAKGIHVIQEQPVHLKYVQECYQLARQNQVLYKVADCYRKLDAVLAFTKCAKGIHAYESPIYIKAAFSTQVAYPAIDIMMESLPSIRNFKVESLQKDVGVFDILSGSIGGIPVLIEFGNQIDPAIPDSNMMMMHHFSYVYHGGTLSLENTYGPVTWKPRIMVSGTTGNTMEAKLCNLLTDEAEVPAKDFFEDKLIRAIEKELLETAQEIEQGPSTVQVQKGILCAKVWTEMTKVFGYARMKPFNSSNSVNMELITNILEGDKE